MPVALLRVQILAQPKKEWCIVKDKATKKDKVEAAKLLKVITPIEGEMRVVYKCVECGQLFGRRFIPFGLGYGLSVNMCLCQITATRRSTLILESAP